MTVEATNSAVGGGEVNVVEVVAVAVVVGNGEVDVLRCPVET